MLALAPSPASLSDGTGTVDPSSNASTLTAPVSVLLLVSLGLRPDLGVPPGGVDCADGERLRALPVATSLTTVRVSASIVPGLELWDALIRSAAAAAAPKDAVLASDWSILSD